DTEWNYLLPEDEKIAFFQITDFGDLTAEELRNAIMEITQQEPPEAMIIDLRDNSGGYLSAAVDVSDLFLSEGNIVTTRGRGGTVRETFDAKAEDTWSEIPMVLLINGDTASASEIFAACMQDHQRASILGERSFGKGSVQQMIPLPYGGLLKLTTASYHRPSGENIHRRPTMVEEEQWGVKPDNRVEMSPDDAQRKRRYETRAAQIASPVDAENPANRAAYDADPLLKEAVKMLKRQIEPSDDKN
ncbi:MAG: S41 family peptidase, partial [Planctomycetota bacterium]|nr:S41 family peptidase [Planctomycetota bacterium]